MKKPLNVPPLTKTERIDALKQRRFSISGIEIFPNETDRLYLYWLDKYGASDASIMRYQELYLK